MGTKPIQNPAAAERESRDDPNRAAEVVPYAELAAARFARHPAVTITGYALFAILALVVGLLSGRANAAAVPLVCALAIASLTALIAGVVTTFVLPRESINRGLGVVGMIIGALFSVLSIFWMYCNVRGVLPYL
jgi:hypothetical protein